ncbi:peregrin-like isoform X1 [Lingula anatina]|uniref:Peregrin-like isoform X1 n=1 Tax=Lingula anatina TaxID=7574 RepID=A0A1S3IUB0_LINAN|nr:peregrin-like isoform X1 [Lingula anatina]|eukprot:XP_013401119.1 peregrin-like isoform X1 [Lingula anatina]
MKLGFDVKTFCQNLKATKPPYECPVNGCGKIYKSWSGIQFHLYHFDHDNPDNNSPTPQKKPGRKKGKQHHRSVRRSASPADFIRIPAREHNLTYAEAQRLVEVDLDGRVHRINIYEPLEIICQDEIENVDNTEKEEKTEAKSPQKTGKQIDNTKLKKEPSAATNKLPEPAFKVLEDYVKPPPAPPRPASYYRFIEKSVDEMDDEVEYDMDEEDYAWLELVNEQRKSDNLSSVGQEVFEMLMDRFEKEAHFQSQTSGKDPSPSIDEDAVCSICMDGECQNSNVILFCDMCNLAVHQECYGVPYIPEGQWLCRRCLQSPSRAVDCCLCPNKGGAFKQTDDGRWAHVVCALWIPEVGFANTVFLEPVDGLPNIPPARWKLTCYICKQRGTGACIQCHKTNCYTAFHVTCAQQAGLYMRIEPIKEPGSHGSIGVRKTAFCDVHTPADSRGGSMMASDDEVEDKSLSAKKAKAKSRQKMRKARKILAEKRNAMPVVSIPIIPQPRLSSIASKVTLAKKQLFISRLLGYWTLKRQSRNGVPLLRRLQSNHMSRNKEEIEDDRESYALREQLKYWQRLRQDLEKARLLVELIRKREKLKREQMRIHVLATEMQLTPFIILLRNTLDQLQEKDAGNIFAEPVNLQDVPDYLKVVKVPMDFAKMRIKLESHQYKTVDQFEQDFNRILENCMIYNAKDTVFYRAAVRMRDQGGALIRAAQRMAERVGYDPETGLHLPHRPKLEEKEPVIVEDGDELLPAETRENLPLEQQLKILLDKLDYANTLKHNRKGKMAKRIKREVMKVRRQLALQKGLSVSDREDSQSMEAASSEASTSSDSRSHSPEKTPSKKAHKFSSKTPTKTPKSPKSPRPRSPSSPRHSKSTSHKTPTKVMSPPKGTPGRPKGRGGRGPGRPRIKSESESEHTPTPGHSSSKKKFDVDLPGTPSRLSDLDTPTSSKTATPSPSGVNRRTAVLFSKKNFKKPLQLDSPSPKRGPGRPPKPKTDPHSGGSGSQKSDSLGPGSPTSSPSSRKRSASASNVDVIPSSPSKRIHTSSESAKTEAEVSSGQPSNRRDSFLTYRTEKEVPSSSDSDTSSELGTTEDDSMSDSNSQSSESEEDEEGEGSSSRYSKRGNIVRTKKRSGSYDSDDEDLIPLEPLDLVWAKCRGYPWYPALIINPKMPKTGYFHNGVPIPVPPDGVLDLQKRFEEPVYLVLFFDTKRTWQWLPRDKLDPLGVDSGLDKSKLLDNKKPAVKKAVKKAYEKAIAHRCRVTGEPNPLSGESSSED